MTSLLNLHVTVSAHERFGCVFGGLHTPPYTETGVTLLHARAAVTQSNALFCDIHPTQMTEEGAQ